MVTDRQFVRLFDFHPDYGTWNWPGDGGQIPELAVHGWPSQPPQRPSSIVIRVSVSYPVTSAQTQAVVPDPAFEVDLTVQPQPQRNVVKSERQTREYGRIFREVLDAFSRSSVSNMRIHLFYSGPVALAFHLGQQVSDSIHPPVTVWNFSRGYDWGVNLAAAAIEDECIVYPPAL